MLLEVRESQALVAWLEHPERFRGERLAGRCVIAVLAFVVGPAFGGLLADFGQRVPFYAVSVIAGSPLRFSSRSCLASLPS